MIGEGMRFARRRAGSVIGQPRDPVVDPPQLRPRIGHALKGKIQRQAVVDP